MESRKFDLENRLIEFSALIIDVVETLPISRVGNHIAGQLLRSELQQLQNMVKHKAQNHAETSSTSSKLA